MFSLSTCSSLRQDCEAGIRVGLTKDKQCLTITAINDCHNHEVSKVISMRNMFLYVGEYIIGNL